jgi:hypothetical protein
MANLAERFGREINVRRSANDRSPRARTTPSLGFGQVGVAPLIDLVRTPSRLSLWGCQTSSRFEATFCIRDRLRNIGAMVSGLWSLLPDTSVKTCGSIGISRGLDLIRFDGQVSSVDHAA